MQQHKKGLRQQKKLIQSAGREVDDLLNFDDHFHNVWQWHIDDLFNEQLRLSFDKTVQSPRCRTRHRDALKSLSSFVYVLIETLTFREPAWRLVVHFTLRLTVLEPGVALTPFDPS